jgi:hypothetical protein
MARINDLRSYMTNFPVQTEVDLYCAEIIDRNIEIFRALSFDEAALPFYDVVGDTIVWTDEISAAGPPETLDVLRILLNRRTWLAIGKTPRVSNAAWLRFQAVAPRWPGFAADRCDPAVLSRLYESLFKRIELPDA